MMEVVEVVERRGRRRVFMNPRHQARGKRQEVGKSQE